MKPLYLNIENGIRIQFYTFHLFYVSHQFLLLDPLDLGKLIQHRAVIFKGEQFFQFICVLFKALADQPGNIGCQFSVAG